MTFTIDSVPINKPTSLALQKFRKKLLGTERVERIESKKQPKGLNAKTVRDINQIIASALNLATQEKLTHSNPIAGCALPILEHKEMKTLTAE